MTTDALHRAVVALLGRQARLRWAHLILGGALVMPYLMLALVVAEALAGAHGSARTTAAEQVLCFVVALPLAAASAAVIPAVRVLEGNAARVLLGGVFTTTVTGSSAARGARGRTAAWFALHLGLGGLVAGLSLAIPPFAAVELAVPLLSGSERAALPPISRIPGAWAPPFGLALLVALVLIAFASGRVLVRWAPALLGPSPAEALAQRLADAEQRAGRLAQRNRIARELHDSVGHALSVVTLQAGAAGRVLDRDPEFARRALTAIEETARGALEELDQVLGLLRRESDEEEAGAVGEAAPALAAGAAGAAGAVGESVPAGETGAWAVEPAPQDLSGLVGLLDSARAAGHEIRAEVSGDPAVLPPLLSRHAFRIVQEGLTNALRHGADDRVDLQLSCRPDMLELTLSNRLRPDQADDRPGGARPAGARVGGGRGLTGIRERVSVLGGTVTAEPRGDSWRLRAALPIAVALTSTESERQS